MKTLFSKKLIVVAIGVLVASFALVACTADNTAKTGTDIANGRTNYTPTHDVEGNNYNARLRIADNPATIIWCTAAFPTPNVPAFTVPIVGKLTSGNKRPYPTEQAFAGAVDAQKYNPEVAGPDGMFGTSGEYRYGFDPAGNYHDFYGISTYCTTVPNILQREYTTIIVKVSTDAADAQAEAAMKACRDKDPDPSHPCTAATTILGG